MATASSPSRSSREARRDAASLVRVKTSTWRRSRLADEVGQQRLLAVAVDRVDELARRTRRRCSAARPRRSPGRAGSSRTAAGCRPRRSPRTSGSGAASAAARGCAGCPAGSPCRASGRPRRGRGSRPGRGWRPSGRRGRAADPGVATRISTPAAQRLDLGIHRDAAVDDRRAQRDGPAVGPDALVDLHRELAGRDEDERPDRVAGRRERRVRVGPQAVEDGQREGRRLAGPGLGGGEDVAAGEDEGDGGCLDRRRGGVALFGDGLQQIGRQAERIEGQAWCSCMGPGHRGGRAPGSATARRTAVGPQVAVRSLAARSIADIDTIGAVASHAGPRPSTCSVGHESPTPSTTTSRRNGTGAPARSARTTAWRRPQPWGWTRRASSRPSSCEVDGERLALAVIAGRSPARPAAARDGARRLARADLAEPSEAERATGSVVGGISPLAPRRPLPVVVDAATVDWPDGPRLGRSAGPARSSWRPADLVGLTERDRRADRPVLVPSHAPDGDRGCHRLAYSAAAPRPAHPTDRAPTEERRPHGRHLSPSSGALHSTAAIPGSPRPSRDLVRRAHRPPRAGHRPMRSRHPTCRRRPQPPSPRPMRGVPEERRQESCRSTNTAPSGRPPIGHIA